MPFTFRSDQTNKGEIAAADIASRLFKSIVEDGSEGSRPETYDVPLESASRFRDKTKLYREGSLLLALAEEAPNNESAERVLRQYERLIFPPTPTAEGLRRVEELKAAMKDLFLLIHPAGEPKPLSWAADWFRQIGCSEGLNPAVLTLFSLWWMDRCILACKAVADCCPIAFTEEEMKAIDRNLRRFADLAAANAPKEPHAYVRDKVKDGIIALGLLEYVGELCVQQNGCATDNEWAAVMDKAITAQKKAYAIHRLPIYLFEVARLFDFVGDTDNARQSFSAFIEAQANFKPDQIDTLLMNSLAHSHIKSDATDKAIVDKMVALAEQRCR